MADKNTIKTPFGELPCENNTVTMSNSLLMKEYEKRGIENAAEVLKAVNAAREDIEHEAALFLAKNVVDTLDTWSFKAGQKENRFEVTIRPEQVVTIPGRNGEPTTQKSRYCAPTVHHYSKTPEKILTDEKFIGFQKECEAKIHAQASKANNKPTIKCA